MSLSDKEKNKEYDEEISTDDGKRKTYVGRETDVFQKSKKLSRTPEKKKDASKLDEILKILSNLSIKVDNIESKQEKILN